MKSAMPVMNRPTSQLCIVIGSIFTACMVHAQESLRAWTPADSIGIRYIKDYNNNGLAYAAIPIVRPILPSPDGSKFCVIAQRSDLTKDLDICELQVFDAADVVECIKRGKRPTPIRRVAHASASIAAAIGGARWDESGLGVVYQVAGVDTKGAPQLTCRLDLKSGQEAIIKHEELLYERRLPLNSFVSCVRGDSAVFLSGLPLPKVNEASERYEYPITTLTSDKLKKLLRERAEFPKEFELNIYTAGKQRSMGAVHSALLTAEISPDEHFAIVATDLANVKYPQSWSNYDGIQQTLGDSNGRPAAFVKINMESGAATLLTDAPTGLATKMGKTSKVPVRAFWANDGASVLLTNAAMPFRTNEAARHMAYIAIVGIDDGEIVPVTPLADGGKNVASVEWWERGKSVLIKYADQASDTIQAEIVTILKSNFLSRQEVDPKVSAPKQWSRLELEQPRSDKLESLRSMVTQPHGDVVEFSSGLRISMREDMNTPQALIAEFEGKMAPLIDDDQAVKNVRILHSEIVEWTDKIGETHRGLLTMPAAAETGKVPLVIQITIGNSPNLFRPDGPLPAGYATQALAAKGIAVLNMTQAHYEFQTGEKRPMFEEGQLTVQMVDSAVAALEDEKGIDKARVGILGFSHCGYEVFYAITHAEAVKYAAAIAFDGFTAGFPEYLMQGSSSVEYAKHYNAQMRPDQGAPTTFWDNKEGWMRDSPLFNLDRLRTPFMFQLNGDRSANGMNHVSMLGQIFTGAFALSQRPLELIWLPDGQHPLKKPKQRYAAMEATVEWMCFWLRGEIPSNPERAARWAILRKQQDEVLKTPPPPKGKWVFQPDPVQPEWYPPAETKKEEPKPEATQTGLN